MRCMLCIKKALRSRTGTGAQFALRDLLLSICLINTLNGTVLAGVCYDAWISFGQAAYNTHRVGMQSASMLMVFTHCQGHCRC